MTNTCSRQSRSANSLPNSAALRSGPGRFHHNCRPSWWPWPRTMTHSPSSGASCLRTAATASTTASRVAGPAALGRSFGLSAPKTTCCRSDGMPTVLASPSPSLRTVSANFLTCSASPGWPHRISACRSRGAGGASIGAAGGWPRPAARISAVKDDTMSLALDGNDLPPGRRLSDASEQLAFQAEDLFRVDAVEVHRVVGEHVVRAAHRGINLLALALHVQVPVGEASAGELPAQLAVDRRGLDDQKDLGIGPRVRDEREQCAVDHAGLASGVAVKRGRQQTEFPIFALHVHAMADELLRQPAHLQQSRTGRRGRFGGVRK